MNALLSKIKEKKGLKNLRENKKKTNGRTGPVLARKEKRESPLFQTEHAMENYLSDDDFFFPLALTA